MTVSLAVVVATTMRPTLSATLESIAAAGLTYEDEVHVVVDGEVGSGEGAGPLGRVSTIMAPCSAAILSYFTLRPPRGFGGQPRTLALSVIGEGPTHALFVDDDDTMRPVVPQIRAIIEADPRPQALHVFRVAWAGSGAGPWGAPILPRDQSWARGNIGTPCVAIPLAAYRAIQPPLRWENHYDADFDFFDALKSVTPGSIVHFHSLVIGDIRPGESHDG